MTGQRKRENGKAKSQKKRKEECFPPSPPPGGWGTRRVDSVIRGATGVIALSSVLAVASAVHHGT